MIVKLYYFIVFICMFVYDYYVNNVKAMHLYRIDKALSKILEVTREFETPSIPDYIF